MAETTRAGEDDVTRRTNESMALWPRSWAEADEAGVERVVAAMAPDAVFQASPFSTARGRDQIPATCG